MLRRTLLLITLILSVSTLPVAGVSNPVIEGNVAGVELCPQSICGSAVFAGDFIGEVNSRPARGVFWAGVEHDALPTGTEIADITGGTWLIRTRGRVFFGTIVGGTLTKNAGNSFGVELTMALTGGGTGELTFKGVLDHDPFPPTIIGTISQ